MCFNNIIDRLLFMVHGPLRYIFEDIINSWVPKKKALKLEWIVENKT
jgi:hypothetical protein